MPDSWQYAGFRSPRYTQTPNDLFDELLAPGRLTEAELRVLLYIIRRTFGFNKDADAISLSQLSDGIVTRDGRRLDYGAGVQRKAAGRAVAGLEAKGIIVAARHSSPERGHETTVYRLRWRDGESPQGPEDPRVGSVGPQGRVPPALPVGSTEPPQNTSPNDSQTKEAPAAEFTPLDEEIMRRLRITPDEYRAIRRSQPPPAE